VPPRNCLDFRDFVFIAVKGELNMKDWRINPDLNVARGIITAIFKNGGHCPCVVSQTPETMCPCDSFIAGKGCQCNLFIKEKN